MHSVPLLEEDTELETPQRYASNRGMIFPSDNNAAEVASLQYDPFVSPFLSFAPTAEPPSQPSSSMTMQPWFILQEDIRAFQVFGIV